MAIQLNSSVGDDLINFAVGNPNIPAVSCRFKYASTSGSLGLIGQHNATASRSGWTIFLNNPTTGRIGVQGKDVNGVEGLLIQPTSPSGLNDNAWHTLAMSFDYTSGQTNTLCIDGTIATASASRNWGGTTNGVRFGRFNDAFWATYVGHIAELALYNAKLTDAEALALHAGYSPIRVAPQKLAAYVPAIRTIQDLVGDYALTATGTDLAPSNHPRIIR